MPNWNSILKEISTVQATQHESAFDKVRRKYLKRVSAHTGRNIIAYYSVFLSKPGIQGSELNDEDKNGFMLCIHGLKREKGLDLILHTPGGDGQATVSLVEYLRDMFQSDIRAIVPQIAMSAGTMMACSCREIIMGRESSIGPIDPQFGMISAANMLEEVRKAREDIVNDPRLAAFWSPILSKITPSFIERCERAVTFSDDFLNETLPANMFKELPAAEMKAAVRKVAALLSNNEGKAHNTHIQFQQCADAGLKVVRLEDDQVLQDLVLTAHHCYMHTLSNTGAFKIIENQLGRSMVKMQQQQIVLQGQALGAVAGKVEAM